MLSRLASRAALHSKTLAVRPIFVAIQKSSSAPAPAEGAAAKNLNEGLEDPLDKEPRIYASRKEGPERDLVNFPRPVQKEHPDPVRLAFVPEEYFDFFYKKTGVSGPYVFGAGVWTWLLSKEIYVLEHNFYNFLSLFVIICIVHNKFGPKIAKYADEHIDKWKQDINSMEQRAKDDLKDEIQELKDDMENFLVYKDLMNAKRETAAAALEATYREWQQKAYLEAKKRLDYQVDLVNIERRISQKNMSSWITENVLKSITPAQEADALKKCIADLKSLSASA